jgi:predicted Rossmann fold flavoprotein
VSESAREVVVVGAGAAGLMAAISAAEAGAAVTLLERTSDGGRKILISGGGRCNVLPSQLTPGVYITESSKNTLKKILLGWPLAQQRAYFEQVLGIPLRLEEATGKLFPASNRARDVRDALVERARCLGVETRFGIAVRDLVAGDAGWRVVGDGGDLLARAVIMATGGLSVPRTGSDGAGLVVLDRLGHTIHRTYPALTPLIADPPVHADLAGLSLEVRIHTPPPGGPFEARGGFLFTHRGYSGPAVLDVSHVAVRSSGPRQQPIFVAWGGLAEGDWAARLTVEGGERLRSAVRGPLPERLAQRLLAEADLDGAQPLSQLRREDRKRLLALLTAYPLPWTGDEGYKKAEVTGGGVSLAEVDPGSLESRLHPGLFLCGELLDSFGPIGGYNFAWAWATGRTAGLAAAAASLG